MRGGKNSYREAKWLQIANRICDRRHDAERILFKFDPIEFEYERKYVI